MNQLQRPSKNIRLKSAGDNGELEKVDQQTTQEVVAEPSIPDMPKTEWATIRIPVSAECNGLATDDRTFHINPGLLTEGQAEALQIIHNGMRNLGILKEDGKLVISKPDAVRVVLDLIQKSAGAMGVKTDRCIKYENQTQGE